MRRTLTLLKEAARPRAWRTGALLGLGLILLSHAGAGADVYGNVGPAQQIPAGGWVGRYPIGNYALDQYFPGIQASLFGGIDVSGVPPLIAFFIAQVIWQLTAFLANALITLFAFAFSLDLVNGSGSGGGALGPVSEAIHTIYQSTFGAPWLIVAILLTGVWAMWKSLVQRRHTETVAALALSLIYCLLALGIVTQPQRTIAPASKITNQLSTAFLSLSSHGSLDGEGEAKRAAGEQLFDLLVLDPWTVLEFGGIEHCVATPITGQPRSVAVQPLSQNSTQNAQLAHQLENATEVHAQGKTCINDRNKYASHFLAYPFQSSGRNAEYEALKSGEDAKLPSSDPAKESGGYPLGPADTPAAEAMGKGGQYQRLLLSILILLGELGAFLLLGALALGVILAQVLLLLLLAFAPVALVVGVFPGRGHAFFTGWLARLAGYLVRKAIYSLILALVLAVCAALDDATSSLGWLMSFALQTAFLWTVFLQRHKLTHDLLTVTTGHHAGAEQGARRLQSLYYTLRLRNMGGASRRQPPPAAQPHPTPPAAPSARDERPPADSQTPFASPSET